MVPYDTSTFVDISIREVVKTLIEAMILVILVMYLFLENVRATFIPTVVVPVSLFGAMIGLYLLGYSINVLTLFAMVLAIAIVVDDAIVVIENVERIMSEEGLSPRDATRKAMGQIFNAIIGLREQGKTVFLVEQNAQAALSIADRAYVIETGETVLSGTGAELLDNEQVRSAYLGI